MQSKNNEESVKFQQRDLNKIKPITAGLDGSDRRARLIVLLFYFEAVLWESGVGREDNPAIGMLKFLSRGTGSLVSFESLRTKIYEFYNIYQQDLNCRSTEIEEIFRALRLINSVIDPDKLEANLDELSAIVLYYNEVLIRILFSVKQLIWEIEHEATKEELPEYELAHSRCIELKVYSIFQSDLSVEQKQAWANLSELNSKKNLVVLKKIFCTDYYFQVREMVTDMFSETLLRFQSLSNTPSTSYTFSEDFVSILKPHELDLLLVLGYQLHFNVTTINENSSKLDRFEAYEAASFLYNFMSSTRLVYDFLQLEYIYQYLRLEKFYKSYKLISLTRPVQDLTVCAFLLHARSLTTNEDLKFAFDVNLSAVTEYKSITENSRDFNPRNYLEKLKKLGVNSFIALKIDGVNINSEYYRINEL